MSKAKDVIDQLSEMKVGDKVKITRADLAGKHGLIQHVNIDGSYAVLMGDTVLVLRPDEFEVVLGKE